MENATLSCWDSIKKVLLSSAFMAFASTTSLFAQNYDYTSFHEFFRYRNHGNGGYMRGLTSDGNIDVKNTSYGSYDWEYIWQDAPAQKYASSPSAPVLTLRSVSYPNNMVGRKALTLTSYDLTLRIRYWSTDAGDFLVEKALDGTDGISLQHKNTSRYASKNKSNTNLTMYQKRDANVKNASFSRIPVQTAAIAYQFQNYETNYGESTSYSGFVIPLMLGSYSSLTIYEATGNLFEQMTYLKSLRVAPGYKVTTYTGSNYTGTATVYTSDHASISTSNVKSIKVELNTVSGMSGDYWIKNVGTGKYMQTSNTANLQLEEESSETDQQFTLTETSTPGLYTITTLEDNRKLGIEGSMKTRGAALQTGTSDQKFYIVKTENSNHFKIVPQCTAAADTCKFLTSTSTDNVVRTIGETYYDPMSHWEFHAIDTYTFTKKDGNQVANIVTSNEATRIVIYDPNGRVINDRRLGAGNNKVKLNIRGVSFPNGIYTYKLRGGTCHNKVASVNVVY